MSTSRAQSKPSRDLDYGAARQSFPTATSPAPATAPHGNNAAQEPIVAPASAATPVLDSVADAYPTSPVGGTYVDPFSEVPTARDQLGQSINGASPGTTRVSESRHATRGMSQGHVGEREERGATVDVAGNQVDVGVRWDDLHHAHGQAIGTSQRLGWRVSESGHGVTAARSETTTATGGGTQTSAQRMALTSDGTLSGSISASSTDADGSEGTTRSATGSARIGDESGRVTAGLGLAGPKTDLKTPAGADAGFSKWTARGTGGVSWRWGKPRQTPSGWAVDYELGASVGGSGGGVRGGPEGSGLQLAGSVGVEVERVASGSVAFPDEAAAQSFHASPDPTLAMGPSANVDDALAMLPGSSARTELGGSIGASATGSAHSLSLGVGGGLSASSGIEVERLQGERVRVTVDRTRAGQLGGSFGAGFIAMQGGASAAGLRSASWQLDLSTPGGAAAYEALLTGATADLGADGVQRDTTVDSTASSATFGANIAGLSATVGTTASDTTQIDGQGRRTDEALGTADVHADFAASSWLGWRPWGSTVGLAATTRTDEHGAEIGNEVEARGTVRGGNAKANYEMLGQVAGVPSWAGHQGAGTPGTLHANVDFGDESLDDLVEILTDPAFSPARFGVDASVSELADALTQAGTDRDAQRAAVQAYGDHGSAATAVVRRLLRDDQVYVALEGSTTWIGERGWDEVEREEAWLVDNQQRDATRVEKRARELLATHQARLNDLGDYGRYDDVPKPIRHDEIFRTKQLVKRLGRMLPDTESDFVGPSVEGAAAAVRDEMDERYRRVRKRQEVHGVGDTGGSTLRGDLGDAGVLGFFAGPERETYDEAEALVRSGEEARRMGNKAEAAAKVLDMKGLPDPARGQWQKAHDEYERALDDFTAAFDLYLAIQKRHGIAQ